MVRTRRSDGATGYLSPDGTLLIHNPKAEGTIFYPTPNPYGYFNGHFDDKE